MNLNQLNQRRKEMNAPFDKIRNDFNEELKEQILDKFPYAKKYIREEDEKQ